MRIVYIAADGTEFDNAWDCETYEDKMKYPELKNIAFYDQENNIYFIGDDLFDSDIYNNCEKVLIHNENEYNAFQWLAEECGYCEFSDFITSAGFWERQADESNPTKVTWKRTD